VRRAAPAAVALAAIAAPAGAQIAFGRSGSSTMRYTSDEQEIQRGIWTFGRCFANQRPRDAKALLATAPGSEDEAKTYRRVMKGEQSCLGYFSSMSMSPLSARGAIAEGMYRRAVDRAAAPLPAATAAPGRTLSASMRCFVALQPAKAKALIFETGPGGRDEAAIQDDYQRCLPEDFRVTMPATTFRFAVAEALYQGTPATVGQRP
jgi:hypothetical protein